MHYPSDVLAGAVLGVVLGSLTPGLSAPPTEERLIDLVNEVHGSASPGAASNGAPPPAQAAAEPPNPAA
jgi:hypothetical protein